MANTGNWERVEFWENYSTLRAIRQILFSEDPDSWTEFKNLLRSFDPLLGKAPVEDTYWYYAYLSGFSHFLDDNLDYLEITEKERQAFNLPLEVQYVVLHFNKRDWPEAFYFTEEDFHQLEKEIELGYAEREEEDEY